MHAPQVPPGQLQKTVFAERRLPPPVREIQQQPSQSSDAIRPTHLPYNDPGVSWQVYVEDPLAQIDFSAAKIVGESSGNSRAWEVQIPGGQALRLQVAEIAGNDEIVVVQGSTAWPTQHKLTPAQKTQLNALRAAEPGSWGKMMKLV